MQSVLAVSVVETDEVAARLAIPAGDHRVVLVVLGPDLVAVLSISPNCHLLVDADNNLMADDDSRELDGHEVPIARAGLGESQKAAGDHSFRPQPLHVVVVNYPILLVGEPVVFPDLRRSASRVL